MMSLQQGDTIRGYQIIEEVGRGGMATVFRARQPSLGRDVAIKVLHPYFAQDATFKERFSREASTIARLRHPNIVTIYDYGEEDRQLFIVMEFLDRSLFQSLVAPYSPDEAVTLLRPIADALDYAHRHQVIHRDVKPSNILLDADNVPTLTDFGLSWIDGSLPHLTQTGAPVGTPYYMAPEVANGQQAGPSVDIYALGVIAYEMLTGRLPYTGDSPLGILLAHVNQPLPAPRSINPDLTSDTEAVLQRALEKNPDDRYQNAQEFIDALAAAIAGRPKKIESDVSLDDQDNEDTAPAAYSSVFDNGLVEAAQRSRSPWPAALMAAIQFPEALLPLALSIVSFAYFLLLAPELGFGISSVVVGMLFLLAAAKGVLNHLGVEYDLASERITQEQERHRSEETYSQLKKVSDSLRDGFEAAGSQPGRQVLTQLNNEFEHWKRANIRRGDSDPLSMLLVPQLVIETYRRGISALGDALALAAESADSDVGRLKLESRALEEDLKGPLPPKLKSQKEALLSSHRERLAGIAKLNEAQEKLFFQAELCEAALHKGRMEVVAMRSGARNGNVDAVIQALQKTIEQVKEVQAEVRRLGY
jgi:serine/threonine protein kinase